MTLSVPDAGQIAWTPLANIGLGIVIMALIGFIRNVNVFIILSHTVF